MSGTNMPRERWRVAVVHNPSSGTDPISQGDLRGAIEGAGHVVASCSATSDDDWQALVATDVDVIVAAGGDGTVRKVLTSPLARSTPVTVLALGTCNNTARTLGLPTTRPLDAIGMWVGPMRTIRYHLPIASADGEQRPIVEGAGAGIFAELVRRADAGQQPRSDADIWELFHEVVLDAADRSWKVVIDDEDASGRYLAVQATMIRETGPNLCVAPDAHPTSDGVFVALVGADQRDEIGAFATAKRRGEDPPTPMFEVRSARQVAISPGSGEAVSIDDDVLPAARHLFVGSSDLRSSVLVPARS